MTHKLLTGTALTGILLATSAYSKHQEAAKQQPPAAAAIAGPASTLAMHARADRGELRP